MRKLSLLTLLLLALAVAGAQTAFAHDHDSGAAGAKHATKYACPMGCKIMDKPGKCPVCGMAMEALPDDDADADSAAVADPYYLATSPTGRFLGAKPVVEDYNGRELRFADAADSAVFHKSPDKYLEKVNAQIIADQAPLYPLDTCPVTGEKLEQPVDYVYNNRLVRFCCSGCISEFESDPAKYMAQIDAAVKAKQSAGYPLQHCIVLTDEKPDGKHDIIVGGRLFELCCGDCVGEVDTNPSKWVSKLEAAWAGKS